MTHLPGTYLGALRAEAGNQSAGHSVLQLAFYLLLQLLEAPEEKAGIYSMREDFHLQKQEYHFSGFIDGGQRINGFPRLLIIFTIKMRLKSNKITKCVISHHIYNLGHF